MKQPSYWLLALLFLAALPAPGRTQGGPAPVYSLPADGTWVEYAWVQHTPAGKQFQGTLKISSVGREVVGGSAHRWIEIKLSTGQGDDTHSRYRKLLVEEKALTGKSAFLAGVRRCYDMPEPGGKVTRLSPKRLLDFLGPAIRGDAPLRERGAAEEVRTKLGKFEAQPFTTAVEGRPAPREYHGWLTDRVPFGWAKFEIHEANVRDASVLVFRAAAVRTGGDARSEVDESWAK